MGFYTFYENQNDAVQVLLLIALALAGHVIVYGVRHITTWLMSRRVQGRLLKAHTITGLASSILIFSIYFGIFGLALAELGVPIGAYFASASVIGLAVAFGSQGLVQDVMSGMTIIFTDLFDVGDMVEIGGQTGIVQRLGMRFTVLTTALGAEVFVPNRTITNVINYPRGYVRCLADVSLSTDPESAQRMEDLTRRIVTATGEQFPGILRTPPDYEGIQTTSSGRTYLRVKFRIWPGRGGPIETGFKQEVIQALKAIDPDYADWMVSINYEVERK
jgi:small conductance mechanosensitive channel